MDDMEIRVYLEEADVKKDFFDCKENNLKCPFCQQELKELYVNGNSVGFRCKNKNCPETNIMCGTKALWQELIRTRRALDVAVDALKLFDSGQYTPQPDSYGLKTDASRLARKALEQITALEQKDVK